MRNRVFEALAALTGVAIVVFIYLYRQDGADEPVPVVESAVVQTIEPILTPLPKSDEPALEAPAAEVVSPAVVDSTDDPAEVESARAVWQAAVADLEAVEAELEVLDTRFDAKEAELLEMEAQGMDPEVLEEEMLIFLDGIVDEYDELEARLAEAEELEIAAAERLAELGFELSRPAEP
jgi:hypothetical protein